MEGEWGGGMGCGTLGVWTRRGINLGNGQPTASLESGPGLEIWENTKTKT